MKTNIAPWMVDDHQFTDGSPDCFPAVGILTTFITLSLFLQSINIMNWEFPFIIIFFLMSAVFVFIRVMYKDE